MIIMLCDVRAEWILDTSLLLQVARRKQLTLSKSVGALLGHFVLDTLQKKCNSENQAVAVVIEYTQVMCIFELKDH